MAWTEFDLTAVETAIAKGEKQVAFADRVVTYRDIDDLLKARATIKAALAGRARQTLLVAGKGFQR